VVEWIKSRKLSREREESGRRVVRKEEAIVSAKGREFK
jgi:hypothetical protein